MQLVTSAGATLDMGAMLAWNAAKQAGCPNEVNTSYRDTNYQAQLFNANYTRAYLSSSKRDRRVWNGNAYWRRAPYNNYVSVAVPGSSLHEKGLALDLGDNARAWMRQHGARYGWIWPAWAQKASTYEPWHFEYNGSYQPPTTTPTVQEDDMAYPVQVNGGPKYLIGLNFINHLTDKDSAELTMKIVSADDSWIKLSAEQFNSQLDNLGIPRSVVDGPAGLVAPRIGADKRRGGMWSAARQAGNW